MLTNLIYEALYDVVDPEIGVNIVDLGLVYDVEVADKAIFLTLTLTSAACPLQKDIEKQITTVLTEFNKPIQFKWVFTPLWSPAYITDEGREQMSALGAYIPVYT